jgi:hypothetical protein
VDSWCSGKTCEAWLPTLRLLHPHLSVPIHELWLTPSKMVGQAPHLLTLLDQL